MLTMNGFAIDLDDTSEDGDREIPLGQLSFIPRIGEKILLRVVNGENQKTIQDVTYRFHDNSVILSVTKCHIGA